MPGNSFGEAFRLTTAGESHGPANIAIIDGCPASLPLSSADFESDMKRRRPAQSELVSTRKEPDHVEILSGVFEGKSTGTPIALLIANADAQSKDYDALKHVYRPGHADLSYEAKYGRHDHRGGGRASARESVSRVAAGVIAKKLLKQRCNVDIYAFVRSIGLVDANIEGDIDQKAIEFFDDTRLNPVRCPDHKSAEQMIAAIEQAKKEGDSLGGIVELRADHVPAGLGEPVFDKLKADLAKAILSIPAVVGFEYGAGFSLASMKGSATNDPIVNKDGITTWSSNRHGGILGGISTSMPIIVRAALKATSSVSKLQKTVDSEGREITLNTKGRHDPCVVPRFVPIGEAMVALVLADHYLRQQIHKA